MMPSYLDFYGLSKAPFDDRPGRGPVLATRALREAIGWVTERLDADHTLLCVAGQAGIGRSSLARVLPGRLAGTCRVARVLDPNRPWPAIRVAMADQLFLDAGLCRDTLVTARSLGDRVVVVVDAAEHAGPELLKHLGELLDMRGPAREPLVQLVVLARDPHPPGRPLWAWLESQRALFHALDRISPDEIHGYIRKRLETAGRPASAPLFSEAASAVVHRHSEGVPRRVNGVCDVVLEAAAREGVARIDACRVDRTMGSAGR